MIILGYIIGIILLMVIVASKKYYINIFFVSTFISVILSLALYGVISHYVLKTKENGTISYEMNEISGTYNTYTEEDRKINELKSELDKLENNVNDLEKETKIELVIGGIGTILLPIILNIIQLYSHEIKQSIRKRGRLMNKKIVLSIFLMIIIPICISLCVYFDLFNFIPGGEAWLGFWGSYLGAILGGIITLIVFWGTVRENKVNREKEEKLRFFDVLIERATCITQLQERILLSQNDEDLIYQLNTKALELKLRLEIASKKNIYAGTEKPIKLLDDMMSQIEEMQKVGEDIFISNNEQDILIKRFKQELCKRGFMFEIKKFITQNDK